MLFAAVHESGSVQLFGRRNAETIHARRVNDCDETRDLEPIDDCVERGITPVEELLEKFHGAAGGSVEPVFAEYAY